MSGQLTLYREITTSKPFNEVMDATEESLKRLGGVLQRTENAFNILNGKSGVSMSFVAEINARVTVRQKSEGKYEIECNIDKRPNAFFWVCLIVGFFFLWSLWIFNGLYFAVNPLPIYQTALDNIEVN